MSIYTRLQNNRKFIVLTVLPLYILDLYTLPISNYWLFFIGWLLSDFIGGILHWFGDSYYQSSDSTFFKHFIDHHIHPNDILNHDYYFMEWETYLLYFIIRIFFGRLSLWTAISTWGLHCTYFHKQAHMYGKSNKFICFLQKYHIILPPDVHHIHHTVPHNRYYCVCIGILNPFLEKIKFWNFLEWSVYYSTGIPSTEIRRLYPERLNI